MRQRSGRNRVLPTMLLLALAVAFSACAASSAPGTASNSTGNSAGQTPTAAPTATSTPTPTSIPITSCAQVSAFASAGSISTGSSFSEVGFPAHTVGFVKQKFETNSYQFEILSACTSATTTGNIHSYYSTGLPSVGFANTSTYPYNGNASSACGDPYCWYKGSAHPSFQASRYLSLENVKQVGSVVTYNLRLSITPLVFKSVTIKGTYEYDFDLVDNPDVQWEIISGPQRQMTPEHGATLATIGVTNFNNVTYAQLKGLAYSNAAIDGNADPSNKIYPGVVWAVHTDSGRYVKVLVDGYGLDGHVNDITVDYVRYDFTF